MSRYDDLPPVQRVTIERTKAGWILVSLDGVRVWKRYTRDRRFTRAMIGWYANQSPSVPKSREAFEAVHLGGDWRAGKRWFWHARNGCEVALPPPGETWEYVLQAGTDQRGKPTGRHALRRVLPVPEFDAPDDVWTATGAPF